MTLTQNGFLCVTVAVLHTGRATGAAHRLTKAEKSKVSSSHASQEAVSHTQAHRGLGLGFRVRLTHRLGAAKHYGLGIRDNPNPYLIPIPKT